MARTHSGSGDPKTSMELLWRQDDDEVRRGPKPRLRLGQIVNAAVELVDEEGVAALSMRKVAERVGTTAMSIYTYLPSKAELIDLMVDAVLGELPAIDHALDWRAKLTAIAHDNRALLKRHPWLLQLTTHRPVLGPHLIAKYDRELATLDGLGLSDVDMDLTLTLINEYVWGAARSAAEAPEIERASGMSDDDWWLKYGPLLERVFDAEKFPVAARVGPAASEAYGGLYDPDRNFAFGLARVLDGIELFLQRHKQGCSEPG